MISYMLKHEVLDYMLVVFIFYMLDVCCMLIASRCCRHARLMISYLLVFFLLPKRAVVEAAQCDVIFPI